MQDLQLMMGLAALCLAAGLYAAAQTIRDVHGRNFGWGAAGGVATLALFGGAAMILLQPVETHAVKINLPVR
jgi:energy-converting hydrogenase Eha subunit H